MHEGDIQIYPIAQLVHVAMFSGHARQFATEHAVQVLELTNLNPVLQRVQVSTAVSHFIQLFVVQALQAAEANPYPGLQVVHVVTTAHVLQCVSVHEEEQLVGEFKVNPVLHTVHKFSFESHVKQLAIAHLKQLLLTNPYEVLQVAQVSRARGQVLQFASVHIAVHVVAVSTNSYPLAHVVQASSYDVHISQWAAVH